MIKGGIMKYKFHNYKYFAIFIAAILALVITSCQAPKETHHALEYEKISANIPMRDGVHLHALILKPKDAQKPLPFLITRTPYDADETSAMLDYAYKELAEEGYIFVFQDIRGRFKSEGDFVMMRPPRDMSIPDAIDETTDTNDTIDWLIKNVHNNNGRVGILGISYPGWLTTVSLIEPHPALKAASPQASVADMFIGDDFYHKGAFRLCPSFEFVAVMERSRGFTPFTFPKNDVYEWFLELGPLSNVNEKYFHGEVPTWNNFMTHPNYDDYWQKQSAAHYLKKAIVPTLNVAGWWDAEDFYGPMKIYDTLEEMDSAEVNYLVAGPWRHGGWARTDGRSLGKINFGSATGEYFRQNIQAPWFAFYLKGKGSINLPEALVFETGANEWRRYEDWPPQESKERKLYFHADKKLSFEPLQEDGAELFDSYVSDPADPVPFTAPPISGFWPERGALAKVEDQRFIQGRPDVLSWETDALEQDIIISGRIVAHLFASTTGTDSDWVVKLIDVYPENYPQNPEMAGYQLMIADDVLRGKFRNSFEKPEPIPPNQVVEFVIDLNYHNHRFLKGHKIMVQVQSSWFPLIDRNPQKFIDIPVAKESDYQKATQRIYRCKSYPSHTILPVIQK
jgi:putative CocE/NonD family hydrolase